MPTARQPLSWWIERQIHPEADNDKRFSDAFQKSPPETADTLARLLENQRSKDREFKPHNARSDPGTSETVSITGRVVAVSSLIRSSSDNDEGEPLSFLVDVEIDSTARYDSSNPKIGRCAGVVDQSIKVPILVIGRHFLSQFASLCVDDSVFATCLKTATLYTDRSKAEPVFTTTDSSDVLKLDGLGILDGIDTNPSCSPQATFTQASRGTLISSVASDEFRGANGVGSSCSGVAQSPQQALSQGSLSVGSSSQLQHLSGDNHLVVNKGRLESYSGEITSIVDFMLGIYVIDGVHLLMLTYWPLLSPLLPLREGTRVVVDNVHAILLSDSRCYNWQWFEKIPNLQLHTGENNDVKRALVFGACARSSVRILGFSASSVPNDLPCIIDRSLGATVVGRSLGLVQMIETVETYWNLQTKFPAGPLNSNNKEQRPNAQLIEIALMLTKVPINPKASMASRNLCTEFLGHQKGCSVDTTVVSEPMRVVTLRQVIQRFVDWQTRQKEPGAGLRDGSAIGFVPDQQLNGNIDEVQVVKVYPSSLQLENIPTVGRVVVSDRGSICLQDATGTIKILPHFGSTFPSQQHIGHVYAWNSWYFVNETVDVAGVIEGDGKLSILQLAPEDSMFSLVYASVSDPRVLYVDDTFGGASGTLSSGWKKREESSARRLPPEGMSHCFVFLVRSAAAQICRIKSRDEGWQTKMAVSGVAFKADFQRFHSQLQSQRQPASTREKLDLGTVVENSIDECVLVFTLGEIPALLEPGAAYVVCLSSLAHTGKSNERIYTGKPMSGDGSVTYIKLGRHDHIHPVHVAISGPAVAMEQIYGSDLPYVPCIAAHATSERTLEKFKTNTVYSVRDIHHHCSEAADSRLQPGEAVTVAGVISKRQLLEATAFDGSAGGAKTDGGPSRSSSQTSAVTGWFKTLVVLQDRTDVAQNISLYIKLTSYSHPVGLVPGAHAVVRNATLNISRATGKAYLSATAITEIQTSLASATPLRHEVPSGTDGCTVGNSEKAVEVPFIGQLYAQQRFQNRRICLSGCYIDNVSSIQIVVICAKCGQAVCNMQCCCGTKSLKVLKRLVLDPLAREAVYSEANMTAQVSDGSGIALVAISGADALCEVLQLSPSALESLYHASAQSFDGKFVWRQQRRQGETNQPSAMQGLLGLAVAAATKSAILRVEGAFQSTETLSADKAPWPVVKQPLRLYGNDLVVNRYATVTIAAHKVNRISVAERCWQLLEAS